MARGKWTYHKTYNTGCCGGPGCILMVLTLPLWPIIGGIAAIKEGDIQLSTNGDSQREDKDSHSVIPDGEGN